MYYLDVDKIPTSVTDIMEYFGGFAEVKSGAFATNPMLAGGAIRDLILDREVTDWDFFLPRHWGQTFTLEAIHKQMFKLGFSASVLIGGPAYGEDSESGFTTHTFTRLTHEKVQLIFSNQRIEDFDMSICQVGIDMYGRLHSTVKFDQAVSGQYHTVYLRNYKTYYQLIHGLFDHVPRVQKKYAWNTFIDYEGVTDNLLAKMWLSTKEGALGHVPF